MAGKIRFQADDEDTAFLKRLGKDPNEVGKRAFRRAVRRLEAQERHERVTEAGLKLPHSGAEMVREDRDR